MKRSTGAEHRSRQPRALPLADAEFDALTFTYLLRYVDDPAATMRELVRVVRPGGEIILTTRIGAETGLRGTLEKWLMPLTSRLGWRTEFPWARYERWAEGCKSVRLLERRALPEREDRRLPRRRDRLPPGLRQPPGPVGAPTDHLRAARGGGPGLVPRWRLDRLRRGSSSQR